MKKWVRMHYRNFVYLMAHKYYVMWATIVFTYLGIRDKFIINYPLLLWRAVIHDWSKFTPSEYSRYARYFYGEGYTEDENGKINFEFLEAWLHHIHHSPHHWEYYVLTNGKSGGEVLPIPLLRKIEMVCDWYAAGMTKNGKNDVKDWWENVILKDAILNEHGLDTISHIVTIVSHF